MDIENQSDQSVRYIVKSTGTEADFRRLFSLDQDPYGELLELVKGDREWEDLINRQSGLRLMQPSCAVEEMFSFLCTSNNHLKRIVVMVEFLASQGSWELGYGRMRFPELEVLASLKEQELRLAGFGYRAATIPMAASQVLEKGGRSWLESLKSMSYQEAFLELQELAGVGPKLADCICLFALGHGLAVPVDTHIWQQMTLRFFPEWSEKSVTTRRYQAIGDLLRDRFGELAGVAHQVLFHENLRSR